MMIGRFFGLVMFFGFSLGSGSVWAQSTSPSPTPAQAEQARVRSYYLENLPIGTGFRVNGVQFRMYDRLVYLQDRRLRYLTIGDNGPVAGPQAVNLEQSRCVLRLKTPPTGPVTTRSAILRTQGIPQGEGTPDIAANYEAPEPNYDAARDYYVHFSIRHPFIDGLFCKKHGADSGAVELFRLSDLPSVTGSYLQLQPDAPRFVWDLSPGLSPWIAPDDDEATAYSK